MPSKSLLKLLRTFLLLSTIIFASYVSKAQPYYFKTYQTEDGLPNNTIYASIQDEDGFMWFGTHDGLSRFDGVHFKTFDLPSKNHNKLSRDDISSIVLDEAGVLWLGTNKGIFMFNKYKEELTPIIESPAAISKMVFDNQRRLWFISNETLYRYDCTKRKLIVFDKKKYFAINSICKSSNGDIWLAENNGYLWHFDEPNNIFKKFNLFSSTSQKPLSMISTMQADDEGNIYIGLQNGMVKKFNTNTLSVSIILPYNLDGKLGIVHAILLTKKDELWFGTEKGLFIFNNCSNTYFQVTKTSLTPYPISDDAITTLYKDREGGIWVGTYFGGVNYSPNQRYHFLKFFPDKANGLLGGNVVREIIPDQSGNIWMALEKLGLAKFNPSTNQIEQFNSNSQAGSISFSNIHGLLINNNTLWLGTHYYGLDIMDLSSEKIIKHYDLGKLFNNFEYNFVLSFLKTQSGKIYIATRIGLLRYNPANDSFSIIQSIPTGSFVNCLFEDKNGRIWVGCGRGVYILDPLTEKAVLYKDSVERNSATARILALHQDVNGNIWAATEGNGLWKISNNLKNFKRYTEEDGLPSNTCFKILEDNDNYLWISTYKGLVKLQPQTNHITIFTKEDGLLNDQFNYNSGYKDAQGRLYFGSTQGFILFNPGGNHKKQAPPPLFFTGFQIDGTELAISKKGPLTQSIQFTKAIELQHNQSTFSIDFAALGFTSPGRIQYSYSMSNLSSKWIPLDHNRKVYFTDLKPGDYTFSIRASGFNFDGIQERDLKITIHPPIWATMWAYCLYATIIALISWYLLRSYMIFKESKKDKEIVNAKIEFFTAIAHEIKTPLTLIKGPLDNLSEISEQFPVIKEDIQLMGKNTNRLMNLAGQVLDFQQIHLNAYHLNITEINITEVLKETFEAFKAVAQKRKLQYILQTPLDAIYTRADAEAIQKILSNLFSNATKYAKNIIEVSLSEPHNQDKKIVILFKNDGIIIPTSMREKIFEPFLRLKENKRIGGSGIGLALSRSLINLHNGQLYLKHPENGMNIFVLEIPLTNG